MGRPATPGAAAGRPQAGAGPTGGERGQWSPRAGSPPPASTPPGFGAPPRPGPGETNSPPQSPVHEVRHQTGAFDLVDPAEPPETASFGADPDGGFGSSQSWNGQDEGTELIGKLGYVPKEMRGERGAKKKYRSFGRKKRSSPWAKAAIGAAALALLGGVGWWVWQLGDDETEADDGLTYSALETPCDMLDLGPLSTWADVDSPDRIDEPEPNERNYGTEQKCSYGWNLDSGTGMTVDLESTVFGADARARTNHDMSTRNLAEETGWDLYDSPDLGNNTVAAVRSWSAETGSSNYQVHVQDANMYLVLRLSVYSEVSDEELSESANAIVESYLLNWRD
ncbi:hypothetical protein [Natronoglycomyces albus]|uniref:Uncharacterized protein n=1 Tax=Natronoglycomyces albus TaxID=2811108 RepID=A0A895XWK8_9ACTN|nr:hypothetical protein [Natronoglycomyces albus]QSB06018.1 hypothetical protein JQS30_03590 [Natronoglycomyces albus]